MDPDDERDRGDSDRERLARGIITAMTIGAALSLALDDWGLLVVGLALGIVFWAGSGGGSG